MTLTLRLVGITLLAAFAAEATAATVSLSRSTREVTPEEIAGGAPVGYVHDFFVTADTDLLSFCNIEVDVPLFQDALGSDTAAPAAFVSGLSPAVTADSYLTTPGSTAMLGGGFGVGGDRLWGDLSNDGAQQDFHFARLSVAQTGTFKGRVAVRGHSGPVYLPFSFSLPGSASDLPLLESEAAYSLNYSLDAPTPAAPSIPDPPQNPTSPTLPPVGPTIPPVDPSIPGPGTSLTAKLSLARQSRAVTPQEIAGGAPSGGYVHEFYVTSSTDILSVNQIKVGVPVFQDALGRDTGPLPSELNAISPGLSADSFIDTPGETVILGGGFGDESGIALWGDLSNDGAQEDFLFARLTTSDTGSFSGKIDVRGADSFVSLPFDFLLPGNEGDMALLAGEQTYSLEYSLVPAPSELPPATPNPPATNPNPIGPTLPSEPPIVETPPERPPIVVTPVDPPASDPPTEPAEPEDPPILIESPLVIRPIEWLIDPINIDIALPHWRLGDVDGDMLTWVDLRQWHINNVFTLGDGTAMLLPSVGFYAYEGVSSLTSALGQLSLSSNSFDGAALSALVATAAQDSVIPEPAASLLAAVALIALRATRRRSPSR